MRAPAAVLSMLVTAALPSAAQDSLAAIAPEALCFHARPGPACATFVFTNFGLSAIVSGRLHGTQRPFRVVSDNGVMINVGTRMAIGASLLMTVDEAGWLFGPAARVRGWMSPRASFEIAVGTSLLLNDPNLWPILGLVRWSPAPWLALTARPELLRRQVFVSCDPDPVVCPGGPILTRRRTSIGVEVGEVPGLVVTAAGGAAFLVAALVTDITGSR